MGRGTDKNPPPSFRKALSVCCRPLLHQLPPPASFCRHRGNSRLGVWSRDQRWQRHRELVQKAESGSAPDKTSGAVTQPSPVRDHPNDHTVSVSTLPFPAPSQASGSHISLGGLPSTHVSTPICSHSPSRHLVPAVLRAKRNLSTPFRRIPHSGPHNRPLPALLPAALSPPSDCSGHGARRRSQTLNMV